MRDREGVCVCITEEAHSFIRVTINVTLPWGGVSDVQTIYNDISIMALNVF